jgi:hypothetical protein
MTGHEKKSKIVSQAILEQRGKFTVEDVVNSVRNLIEGSVDSIRSYILKKIETMCEYGLIGKTDIYYFSREQ